MTEHDAERPTMSDRFKTWDRTRVVEAIAQITEIMKGPMPIWDRAWHNEDRRELRERLAEIAASDGLPSGPTRRGYGRRRGGDEPAR